jgi:hypothetical protein
MNKAKEVISLNEADFEKRPLIPVLLNLPTGLVKTSSLYPISTDTCRKWFAYDFDKAGLSPEGLALLDRLANDPLAEYCPEVGKTTPYFRRAGHKGIVHELVEGIAELNRQPYLYGTPTKGLENIPDGAIFLKEVASHRIDLKLMINDMRLMEYHLNNGVTKHSYKLSEFIIKKMNDTIGSYRKSLKNQNATFPVSYL